MFLRKGKPAHDHDITLNDSWRQLLRTVNVLFDRNAHAVTLKVSTVDNRRSSGKACIMMW